MLIPPPEASEETLIIVTSRGDDVRIRKARRVGDGPRGEWVTRAGAGAGGSLVPCESERRDVWVTDRAASG